MPAFWQLEALKLSSEHFLGKKNQLSKFSVVCMLTAVEFWGMNLTSLMMQVRICLAPYIIIPESLFCFIILFL